VTRWPRPAAPPGDHGAGYGAPEHGGAGHDGPGHGGRGGGGGAGGFDALLAEVMAGAERFGHRQHVELTWLAVRRYGVPAAVGLVSDGIRRTARYAGAPQKYHATVSRAWVELVGYHVAQHGPAEPEFATFAERNPALLDKRLLTRFYRPATLASPQAKTGWAEPDLAPFPWQRPGAH
jgi:hypothetical protein